MDSSTLRPQTFDALRDSRQVTYHSGFLALSVTEDSDKALVVAKELATGRLRRFEADRIYIACGAMGTTRLVANRWDSSASTCRCSSRSSTSCPWHPCERPDPREEPDFTLNQFNMIVALEGSSVDISQLHFYTFNSAFTDALPSLLQGRATERARTMCCVG